MTRYTDMDAGDMLSALRDDAQLWATAFCEQFPDVPHDAMIGWFANAIEHSGDVRRGRLVKDDDAFVAFRDGLDRERAFWRTLQAA